MKKTKKQQCDYCKKREAEVFCVGDLTKDNDKGKALCYACFEYNYLINRLGF